MASNIKGVSTLWFAGLTDEERENFKRNLIQSKIVLDKLREIVYNMVIGSEDVTTKDYDTPNWVAKQAHLNGHNDSLRKILTLLELDNVSA